MDQPDIALCYGTRPQVIKASVLRRELARRFPDQSTKGAVGYGVLRSLQLRWLRMPKAQVKLGAKLPERY